ncbi:cupin domain-containing protein [Bordetella petrii]|uniref:cupin domain-containing protein n=1 Tax=Bordetella petrii TaxID=94624 RepID=UPI001E3FB474|nr:cupin domain-containing protein [Bordetella petrii]MCD0502759.1 cupin domain-containing protein [Bordetella petrii]
MEKTDINTSSPPYEAERRVRHVDYPGLRITELQVSPGRSTPWHHHTEVQDTIYVVRGRVEISLLDPQETVILGVDDSYAIKPGRRHLVRNTESTSTTYLVIQGRGKIDFIST